MASLITFTSRTIAENSVKYSKKDFKNLREFEGSIGGTVRLLSKTYNILILTVGSQLISRDQKIWVWEQKAEHFCSHKENGLSLTEEKIKILGGFSLTNLMFSHQN